MSDFETHRFAAPDKTLAETDCLQCARTGIEPEIHWRASWPNCSCRRRLAPRPQCTSYCSYKSGNITQSIKNRPPYDTLCNRERTREQDRSDADGGSCWLRADNGR